MTEPAPQAVRLFAGQVQTMPGDGRPTGIFKQPLDGAPVRITRQGLATDAQADRRVHGGPDKAIHQYPAVNYRLLAAEFRRQTGDEPAGGLFQPANMGENLSTPDWSEADVCLGDIVALGTARLQLCQPRRPCWKIDARFGCDGLARFVESAGCTGWYYRVLEEGEARDGDLLSLLERSPQAASLAALHVINQTLRPDLDELARAAATPGLAEGYADCLKQRLSWLQAQG